MQSIAVKRLKLLYYNARSLLPKKDELKGLHEVESPDVICIVETWLSDSISDNELALSGYQCVRCDRDCQGGGVLIYVHSSFAVNFCCCDADIELLIVSISPLNCSIKICIAVFYRPPSSTIDSFSSLSWALLSLNPSSFKYFVLLGDFNVNFFCSSSCVYSRLMLSLVPFNLTQVVKSGTRTSSSGVFLLLISDLSLLHSCLLLPPMGNSDHSGVQLKLNYIYSICEKVSPTCQ